jgi:uncharacterized RDD family membrane protein YckC
VALAERPAKFKLLTEGRRVALWTTGQTGPGRLYQFEQGWGEGVEMGSIAAVLDGPRDMTIAAERLRLVFVEEDRLFEQRYEWDGTAAGEPVELVAPRAALDPGISRWINLAIMAVLIVIMFSAIRRRQTMHQKLAKASELSLAPLGQRFVAGLVDAIPLIVPAVLVSGQAGDAEQMAEQMMELGFWLPLLAGAGIYLLHTTVAEMVSSRSLGKMLFGLRVVGLDGKRASAGSLFLRNILRIIDLMLFFPLVLVLVSPLRQRVGDIAAETLVVSGAEKEGEEAEATEGGSDEATKGAEEEMAEK